MPRDSMCSWDRDSITLDCDRLASVSQLGGETLIGMSGPRTGTGSADMAASDMGSHEKGP